MNLNTATAIITGASRGLGLATAKALINKGAIVYGLACSANTLDALKSTLGDHFIPIALDITNREKINHWFDATFSADHTPDILINNGGAGNFGNIKELPFEQWQRMIDSVYPAEDHEIGWYPIALTDEAKEHQATTSWEENPTVFHWHSNTFDLPKGVTHLASTDSCHNQAFIVNENIIGLQFHLEIARPQV